MKRRCGYCGKENNILLLELRTLLLGKVRHTCPCGMTSTYILVSHVVHDTTDVTEKELNKNHITRWRNS